MLIGHTHPQAILHALLAGNTLPHALLLHGPKGIGKRKLAEVFAHVLICGGTLENNQLQPNTASPVYAQIHAGACADFLLLEKEEGAASIKIDQARTALGNMQLKAENKRVIIIDAADELGTEAANALLKTLEEPTPNTHFILVAHNLFKVMPTILSRCRKVRMQPLTADETKQVLTQQNVENAEQLTQLASGQPGVALQLGEEGLALKDKLQNVKDVVATADAIHRSKQVPQALDILLQQLATQRTFDAATLYQEISGLRRRMLSHNLSGNWVLETALRKMHA